MGARGAISNMPAALVMGLLAIFLPLPSSGFVRGAAAADLKVGLVLATDGPKAALSDALRRAVEADIARYNLEPDARPVTLVVESDECTVDGGVQAAGRLIAIGVGLVVGHPCSNAAIAAAKVYAQAGVAFLAVGARHPDLTLRRAGPLVFRIGGRDDRQGAETVQLLAEGLSGKRVAVVHDRTRYARGLATEVAEGLRSRVASISVHGIVAGERDYNDLNRSLTAQRVDAVYFSGFPAEAGIVVSAARKSGLNPRFIFADSITSLDLAYGVSGARIEFIRSALEGNAAAIAAAAAASIRAWVRLNVSGSVALQPGELARALRADANGDVAGSSYELAASPQ
jgi:branched-chain amino acid transport system substrate-binding protein